MRVLMMAVGLLAAAGGPGAIGYWIGRKRPTDGTDARIKEHARLLAQSSRASRRGRHGEANIYAEAAARVWSQSSATGTDQVGWTDDFRA